MLTCCRGAGGISSWLSCWVMHVISKCGSGGWSSRVCSGDGGRTGCYWDGIWSCRLWDLGVAASSGWCIGLDPMWYRGLIFHSFTVGLLVRDRVWRVWAVLG